MITPKPKTVFELFDGHPERWIKEVMFRDESRRFLHISESHRATCFCVEGAINWVYPKEKQLAARNALRLFILTDVNWEFNDDPSTTFEMMLAKVKEAGI